MHVGVSTAGGLLGSAEHRSVAARLGRRPEYVMGFEDFDAEPPIAALAIADRWGTLPMISWEPWRWAGDRTSATVTALLDGDLDAYLIRWAAAIADWGAPVLLRFAHEFNGDWYPWSPAGGTTPQAYRAAWRRVRGLFDSRGADNVTWVWAAAADRPTTTQQAAAPPLAAWYPGDDDVDLLGVDGYNWGDAGPGTRWRPPEEIFAGTLDELRALGPGKPILLAEVGCAESGGSKPDWIRALVDYLDAQTGVDGFVWFDHDKETDWRMDSSPESLAAMRAAIGDTEAVAR